MKTILLIKLGVVFLFTAATGILSASPDDFAGTWILDKEKSSGATDKSASKIEVKVSKKQMKIVYINEGQEPTSALYNLKGSTTTDKQNEKLFIVIIKRQLRLVENGEALELTSHYEYKGKDLGGGTTVTITTPPTTYSKIWRLQNEGKVLLIQDGQAESAKLVYNRQ